MMWKLFSTLMLVFSLLLPSYGVAQTTQLPTEVHENHWACPMRCEGLSFDKPGTCPVCGMALVSEQEPEIGGDFFGDALLDDADTFDRPDAALMPGLSTQHAYAGAILALILVLLLVLVLKAPTSNMKKTSARWTYPRWDLTRGRFGRLVKWRGFQFSMQAPVMVFFVLVVAAGLFGNQDASANIAPVLTWNIWWMGLIFFAFFAGEIWCTVCPWMALPDWISRVGAKITGATKPLGRQGVWPKWAQNLYPAIAMFIGVTWLEVAYEAPYRPRLTALMALGMVALAAFTLFAYERKGFCRYLCPVGRVTGAYGMTGMLEIRRRDTDVCHTCTTKDCLNGNERGLPCPTREYMGAMNENMYCTMCTECVRTCPHDNVAINVRTPFVDIMGPHRKRMDEAWLLIAIVIVSIFHGLSMVPFWTQDTLPVIRRGVLDQTGWDPGYLWVFTAAMAAFFVGSALSYWAWAWLALKFSALGHRTRDVFIAFTYALLPVALGYHLAHNALHFFYEGSKLVRLASDPFGWGWDLFGTSTSPLTMLIPMEILWIGQILLTLAGLVWSVLIIRRVAYRLCGNRHQTQRLILAASLLALVLTLVCMWLLNQPMEMRTA